MLQLSTIVHKGAHLLIAAGAVLLFHQHPAGAADCAVGKGFTSNNIRYLAAKGDTLWMITERDQSLSFNMIAGEALKKPQEERNWWSYSLDCRREGVNEIALGGGYAAASFDSSRNVLWLYNFETERMSEKTLRWPELDSLYNVTVVDMAYAGGVFFCAAQNGGLVRWNHETDHKTVFFPGNSQHYDLEEIQKTEFPAADSMRKVTAVEARYGDSLLLVVTPGKIWQFSLRDTVWDSVSVSSTCTEADLKLRRFDFVFVNALDASCPLYAVAAVTQKTVDTTYLMKYNRKSGTWDVLLSHAPKALTFGHNATMYMLFDEVRPGSVLQNLTALYRDVPGDSGCVKNPSPLQSELYFNRRMTTKYDVDYPDEITDIAYVAKNDSTGYLWIATSEGLFLSENEKPGTDTSSFLLIKRAPRVQEGLKTTYARPGIITPSTGGCVFVYNIKKTSARVTIRVYDYNMDLVKTVIEKQPRLSGTNGGPLGRSTVESEDNWDGKNAQGRTCAPGIYYYKITTDSGERSFGKIVIAR